MSIFSKWISRQLKKRGLTGIVMYIVRVYVKSTPSKEDDKFLEKVESMFRAFEK